MVDVAPKQIDSLSTYFHSNEQAGSLYAAVADLGLTPPTLKDQSFNHLNRIKSNQKRSMRGSASQTHKLSLVVICRYQHVDQTMLGIFLLESRVLRVRSTGAYRKLILKEWIKNDQCRICSPGVGTLTHLIIVCTVKEPMQHMGSYNIICNMNHQNLAYKHSSQKYTQLTGMYRRHYSIVLLPTYIVTGNF